MKDKQTRLIVKHALKRALCYVEFSSSLVREMDKAEKEYISEFKSMLTDQPEYKELLKTLSDLILQKNLI